MESKIISVVEEQVAVEFTGKVNVLASYNRQYLGHILFMSGEILQVKFQNATGLKAFYQLLIQEHALTNFDYVVEPEVVDANERQIHYPYSILKTKMNDVLRLYTESLKFKPPGHVKLVIDADFLNDSIDVSPEEFDILSTLTEWNKVDDVYQHCALLDHEITWGLVSLRKKNALKVLASRNGP